LITVLSQGIVWVFTVSSQPLRLQFNKTSSPPFIIIIAIYLFGFRRMIGLMASPIFHLILLHLTGIFGIVDGKILKDCLPFGEVGNTNHSSPAEGCG